MSVAPLAPASAGRQAVRRFASLRWRVREDWAPVLFDREGLRLDQWLASGAARVVKRGTHRTVYEARAQDRSFFIKHYRCATWLKAVANGLRGSAARREWDQALELARRGISTVVPVACGEQLGWGLVRDSFFVSEAVPHARPAEQCLAELEDAPADRTSAARRHEITKALARFVAKTHEAGVFHDDFHLGNVLLRTDVEGVADGNRTDEPLLFLIDLPGIRLGRALTWRQSRRMLVMLLAGVLDRVSRTDRLRFWRAYLHGRSPALAADARRAGDDVACRALPYLRAVFRSRDRRALATNRDFYVFSSEAVRAHATREVPPSQLATLAADPAVPFRDAPADAQCVEAVLAQQPVRWERFPAGPPTLLRRHARRDPALRRWYLAHALASRGIAASRPLCVLRRRRPRSADHSYLAVELEPRAVPLPSFARRVERLPPDERAARRRELAQALGRLVGRMHRWCVVQPGLAAGQFAVFAEDGAVRLLLIDYEGIAIRRRVTRSARVEELAALLDTVLSCHPASRTDCLRFLRAYLGQSAGTAAQWKKWWRLVSRASRASRPSRGTQHVKPAHSVV